MSVTFTFRPLDNATWQPDGRDQYKSCQFKASYAQTMKDLRDELRRIGVKEAVIEADVGERGVRLDGQLRADAKPASPRVRLSFTHPGVGPLQYPCDTYSDWKDNLRAIVKTLEAQRAMDRYGATRNKQQYQGWKQLTGKVMELGAATPEPLMPLNEATETIIHFAGERVEPTLQATIGRTFSVYRAMYRDAVRKTHPDAGGNPDDFKKVLRAKTALDLHHGEEA